MSRVRSLVVLAGALLLLAGACSSDDGSDTRAADDTASPTDTAAHTEDTPSETAAPTTAAVVPAVRGECLPHDSDLGSDAAESEVVVTLADFTIEMSETEIPAGNVRFVGENIGTRPHEFYIMKGSEIPEDAVGNVDKPAMGAAFKGEVRPFAVGDVCDGTLAITEPGEYSIFCALLDGDGTSHYAEGMFGSFTVVG